jgi:hypothetical protein
MTEALQGPLVLTYCAALCGCLGCWQVWRRWLDGIASSFLVRRGLVCAYWALTVTVLIDILASLKIRDGDVTPEQFKILFAIAVATMFQMALVALVLAPVAMRFAPGTSLRKALIILESGAFISMVVWAIGILANMHEYGQLAK